MIKRLFMCLGFLFLCLPGGKLYAHESKLPVDSYTVHQSDTIKKKKKDVPDSVGVKYEDGKFKSSDNLSGSQLRKIAESEMRNRKGKGVKDLKNTDGNIGKNKQPVKNHSAKLDSLENSFDRNKDLLTSSWDLKAIPVKRVYSNRKLKAMYDSAGIGKMDSVLAFTKQKSNISDNELIDKLNTSMGGKAKPGDVEDLSRYKMPSELLQELSPMKGRKLKDGYKPLADSLAYRYLSKLDSVTLIKYPDSLVSIPGSKIIQYSNVRELDSLKLIYPDSLKPDSIMLMPRSRFDSLKSLAVLKRNPDLFRNNLRLQQADTLRDKLLDAVKGRSLKAEQINERLEEASLPQKHKFLNRFYFEGLASFSKSSVGDELRFSPGFGFNVIDNLSVGLGVNLLLRKEGKRVNMSTGYRSFLKYEMFKQRAYIQAEDWVDPVRVTTEGRGSSRHSILLGAGYILPVGKRIGINGAILYRVNNDQYENGQLSPWVIRLGISTLGSKQK